MSIICSQDDNVVELRSKLPYVLAFIDVSIDGADVPSMKGASERNAISWMKNCLKLNCEVMSTSGRLNLSDNYTRREVYGAYKSDMLKSSDTNRICHI